MRDGFLKASHGSDQILRHIHANPRKVIRWKPSDDGWKRVNTDGVVCQISKSAITDGIVRDQVGIWIAGFAKNIGHCLVIMVDLWGVLDSLQIAWSFSLKKVILETNGKEAIQAIQANGKEQHCSAVICTIKDLLQCDWTIPLTHVFREGNKVEDGLASMTFSRPLNSFFLKEPVQI